LIKHGRADQFLKRVFLGKDEHIAEKLTNLRKLTEREQSMVTVLTLPIATHTPSQIDGAMVFLENANENTSSISVVESGFRNEKWIDRYLLLGNCTAI
jgi:hypothetical protein